MKYRNSLIEMKVGEIMHLAVNNPTIIKADADMKELLFSINKDLRTRHVYVVNEEDKLIGSVRMNAVVKYLFPYCAAITSGISLSTRSTLNLFPDKVSDFMNKDPFFIKENDLLETCAKVMIEEKINELPVVDDNMKLIGQVNVYEMIEGYKTLL